MGKPKQRLPVLSLLCLLAAVALSVRGLWWDETLCWRGLEGDDRSVTMTEAGVQNWQLGLRLYFTQAMAFPARVKELNAVLDAAPPVGFTFVSKPAAESPGMLRRLGMGFERRTEEGPASFTTALGLVVPLWLVAIVCVVRPIRYLRDRRRLAAKGAQAVSTDGGTRMRIAIAVVLGVAVGMAGMYLVLRRSAPPSSSDAAPVSAGRSGGQAVPASAPADIHPIVGLWRVRVDLITATYSFSNDGTFVLTFQGVPGARGPEQQQTQGTWQVEGKKLILRNTATNSALSVVGEEERATIDEIRSDRLVLTHLDRKARPEQLEFQRVIPFSKGTFDNPALLGTWRSPELALELMDSGDARIGIGVNALAGGGLERTGSWSQNGQQLRLMVDARPPSRRGYGGNPPPAPPPTERIFEISNFSQDQRMVVMREITNPKPPHPAITFYRVN